MNEDRKTLEDQLKDARWSIQYHQKELKKAQRIEESVIHDLAQLPEEVAE